MHDAERRTLQVPGGEELGLFEAVELPGENGWHRCEGATHGNGGARRRTFPQFAKGIRTTTVFLQWIL